ncbi:MAG: DMT family transporter [Ectothiorhodospiraceae bacterium]|nr:DMT family transporter [Chromatiales bacterium]MCP5157494.1 DMT family transporter [Ectothiorhodospiraceae bacterium]
MSTWQVAVVLGAVAVGAMTPMQAGINASLARHIANPLSAALTNTVVASACLVVVMLVLRVPLPGLAVAARAPWWSYCGGLLGASIVLGAIVLAPRLGAAAYVSSLIVGTVLSSLLIDHFGLLGFREQPVSAVRLLGGALVVVGMVLVVRR